MLTVNYFYIETLYRLLKLIQCDKTKDVLAEYEADFENKCWNPADMRPVNLKFWAKELRDNPPKESTTEEIAINSFSKGYEITEKELELY